METTKDWDVINSILLNPTLWRLREGVTTKPPQRYVGIKGMTYVLAQCDGKPAAIFMYRLLTPIVMDVHLNVLPFYWDGVSLDIAKEFIAKLRHQDVIQKLVVTPPESCKHIIGFAQKLGFTYESQVKDAVIYNGVLQNILIYSLSLGSVS